MHAIHFPAETNEYRHARDALLRAEMDLRRRMEEVAALRRDLPFGGEVPEDYVFQEGAADLDDRTTVRPVRMSELFEGKDTLVLYNFMYGPRMDEPCPMCTCFIDGLNGDGVHIRQRVGVAIVARSAIRRIRGFARSRGWTRLRLVSSGDNDFNRDYHGEDPEGDQNPVLHTFVRRDGRIRHFWSSELQMVPAEPGQNQRHLDTMWPLWNVLDCTPEGRGTDWYPQLSY